MLMRITLCILLAFPPFILAGCGASGPASSGSASATKSPVAASAESEESLSARAYSAPANQVELDAEASDYAADAPAIAPQINAEGAGPGQGGDKFDFIEENGFLAVADKPLSTFSIDVDTASYSKARMYLFQNNTLPPADAVRIEEFINYFDYQYAEPTGEHPFAVHLESAPCPWRPQHRLARIAIKGKEMDKQRPSSNLVFLIDVSGSMDYTNKLPLLKSGLRMMVRELGENDRVAIVVYAGAAGLVLPSTPGNQQQTILDALDRLHAGGSTNGGEGIRLAYQSALDNFLPGGVNRVILCSDGDFNVGTTSTGDLVRLAETNAKAGVNLSVLGFGVGNHNDAMLEQISNRADGNYAFIDSQAEARKVLVEQLSATLVTIAKDVKIQVEFNPARVAAHRLIGYENRKLADRDFNDDTKDAGEIGAGHTVTALYEIVPVGATSEAGDPGIDPLKYQQNRPLTGDAAANELLTVKLRYKQPDADKSTLLAMPLVDEDKSFGKASTDFQFAVSVSAFALLLRNSEHKGDASYNGVLEIADASRGDDGHGYRDEFIRLVQKAQQLAEPGVSPYQVQHARPAIHDGGLIQSSASSSSVLAGWWLTPQAPLTFWLGVVMGVGATLIAAGLCLRLVYVRPLPQPALKQLAPGKPWK